jgi:chemotaxis protein histidine kinase CheA
VEKDIAAYKELVAAGTERTTRDRVETDLGEFFRVHDQITTLSRSRRPHAVRSRGAARLCRRVDPRAAGRRAASAANLDALMRAAHSIKGAAQAAHHDTVGRIARELEDCVVAAQAGRVALTGDAVDVMLRFVDRLRELATMPDTACPGWLASHHDALDVELAALAALHKAELAELLDQARELVVGAAPGELLHEVLHDARGKLRECQASLTDLLTDLRSFSHQSASLYNEVIGSRMRPFADGITELPGPRSVAPARQAGPAGRRRRARPGSIVRDVVMQLGGKVRADPQAR